ncbi:hypothetical protein MIR68_009495 [Amoeboaphelidium protococcarum]|nr:hypothetical protein MIR68_009495 [Amoeboaphelidium protococcarum]
MDKQRAPNFTKIAKFGCVNCAHRWKSARGQPGVYQKCKECLTPCFPTEFQYEPPNRLGNMNRETMVGHNSELCQKCEELGYSCMNEIGNDDDDDDIAIESDFAQLVDAALVSTRKLSQKERKRLAKQGKLSAMDDDDHH